MNGAQKFSNRLVDEYSLVLLNWAYKKLANSEKAEELVQEVWLQIFSAIRRNEMKGLSIEKTENFIWKIAHFVWCRYLRRNESEKKNISIDGMDFADDDDFTQELANNEETATQILYMRKKIVNLNRLQREIMISFYIDGKSQKEIAKKLGISEASVKWHLFDTRRKLKEEYFTMKDIGFVYRPRKLHMAYNGAGAPKLNIEMIINSLTKQTICLECYRSPQTIDELAERTGIPKAYIESDIEWLCKREFMEKTDKGYATMFMITSSNDLQARYCVFRKYKEELSDIIVSELCDAEDDIKNIGFYGSDEPMNKILWFLIYDFCSYITWQKDVFNVPPPPIRPDGGRYYPLGFDWHDVPEGKVEVDTDGWDCCGPMEYDSFHWYGLYNFGDSEIQDLLCCYTPEWDEMNDNLVEIMSKDFNISGFDKKKKFTLAKLAEKRFVRIDGEKAYPNFCVFTKEQRKVLNAIYAKIEEKIDGTMNLLYADLETLCDKKMPAHLTNLRDLFLRMALSSLDFITTVFAFNAGKLYVPKDKSDGEFLTMFYTER